MFDPFTRADNTHVEGQQGTGLGMSITRNIVKMMNGRIDVQSRQNEGTRITFTVELPYTAEEADTAASGSGQKADDIQKYREEDFNGVNVLLVEDNEINAEIAEEILKMTGMNVDHAWNGSEAIDKLCASGDGYYSLVLMDIQMPIMDGYEATKVILSHDREYVRNIPIIAMSANAFDEDIAKSISIGMNDHIAKPLNLDILLRTLKKYIRT